jgi:hypothetical protein
MMMLLPGSVMIRKSKAILIKSILSLANSR